MDTQEFIELEVFCRHYNVAPAFVNSMREFGLIEIMLINEAECIPLNQLSEAEKLVRLYNDLEINTEGIDVVIQLLDRINKLNNEIIMLRHKLSIYEDPV